MLEQIITSSLLILAVLLLRLLLRGRLSARAQYGLWLLVALRLLIPGSVFEADWTPAAPVEQAVESVRYTTEKTYFTARYDEASGKSREEQAEQYRNLDWVEEAVGGPYEIVGTADTEWEDEYRVDVAVQKDYLDTLQILWYAGMTLMALWFLWTNLAFGLRLRRTGKETGVWAARPVYTADLPSPCLWGRRIYVTPACLEDETQLRHVLAHEEAHLRHGDQLWSLIRCLCLIVWWFHPLVWAAASLSRKDCELAADEGAMKRLGEQERLAYGRTLLDIVARRSMPGGLLQTATTMHSGAKSLKARIRRIAVHKTTKWYVLALAMVLAVTAAACAFTGVKETEDQPLDVPSELTGVDLERETIAPGYFPEGLEHYSKNGRFATLDEVLIEFYSPSPDNTTFPEPGNWRENDGVLHFRLTEDWGCIVTGGDVPAEELVKLVESFYVVSGPEPAPEPVPEEPAPTDVWGVTMTIEDATPIGCVVRFDRDETAPDLHLRIDTTYCLERYYQDEWSPWWPLEWSTIQYQINSGTSVARNLLWVTEKEDEYGILHDGRYRLGMQVRNMDTDICRTYYAEFEVAWEDVGKTLSYESVLRAIDSYGLGFAMGLYLPDYGPQETVSTGEAGYLDRFAYLLGQYRWSPLDGELLENKGMAVTISGLYGSASLTVTDCGGVCELVADDGEVRSWWKGEPLESLYSGGDLVLALRQEYDGLAANHSVPFEAGSAAEAAAIFVEDFGENLMNQSPGSVYRATDYEVLDWELRKTSADGTAVVGWFRSSLTPELGRDSYLWAGSSIPLEEDNYEGPMSMYREFALQQQSDGLWRCVGLGTGGYDLPETTVQTAEPYPAKVVLREEAAVFQRPDVQSENLGRLQKGTCVEVLGSENGWLLVNFPTWDTPSVNVGYVPSAVTTAYTAKTQGLVKAPLYLKLGAVYYEGYRIRLADETVAKQQIAIAYFDEEREQYCITAAGGWEAYLNDLSEVIYPELP